MAKKRKKVLLSSFSIILILIFVLGIISHLLPNAKFVGEEIINGSGTVGAKLSQVLMAPILGFEDAIDIAIFIMMLGGLLKVIGKTGALEAGIKALVQKLKGREILLIPILMFIFSDVDDAFLGSYLQSCDILYCIESLSHRFVFVNASCES